MKNIEQKSSELADWAPEQLFASNKSQVISTEMYSTWPGISGYMPSII